MAYITHPGTTPANRRVAARRQPAVGTVCRLAGPHAHLGLVWNLSTSGVSMFLHEPLARDAVLSAELATTDERDALPVTLRVVHVRKIRTGDYFLGAQFRQPLAPEQLRPFLAEG
jgi:PilZ domain